MLFEKEINELELMEFDDDYIIQKGKLPILFTAPHTMEQIREDGNIKYSEVFTKAIALYLNKKCNVSYMIKINDTGLDSNRDNRDEFKTELLRFIRKNNIKLVIDLHGSKRSRDYDIEFGTLNNISADYSVIKELEKAFINNGINNIEYNNPFKGGAITQYICGLEDVDVIQIEINEKFRDSNEINKLEMICKSFEDFINLYKNK